MKTNPPTSTEHSAKAKTTDLSISFKHSVEISRAVRYRSVNAAREILQKTIDLKRAIPFKRYNKNVAHKHTMAAGRYPQKAAKQFLKLIRSVEANAQAKGMNTANLKITRMLANLASIPFTGKRFRTRTKRTNLEIEVREMPEKKKPWRKPEKSGKKVLKVESGKNNKKSNESNNNESSNKPKTEEKAAK